MTQWVLCRQSYNPNVPNYCPSLFFCHVSSQNALEGRFFPKHGSEKACFGANPGRVSP
jgi:hypothetical protein